MKKIISALAAGALTLSMAACNTPGERAVGGAAIGGLAGAAIGGAATGRGSGALAGAAIGAAGGAVVGAATTPQTGLPLRHVSGRVRQPLLPLIAPPNGEFGAETISALFFWRPVERTTSLTMI